MPATVFATKELYKYQNGFDNHLEYVPLPCIICHEAPNQPPFQLPDPKPSKAPSPSPKTPPRSPPTASTQRSSPEPPSPRPATRTSRPGCIASCHHVRTRPTSPPPSRPAPSKRTPTPPSCATSPTSYDGTPLTTMRRATWTLCPACASWPARAMPRRSRAWGCSSMPPARAWTPTRPFTLPTATS